MLIVQTVTYICKQRAKNKYIPKPAWIMSISSIDTDKTSPVFLLCHYDSLCIPFGVDTFSKPHASPSAANLLPPGSWVLLVRPSPGSLRSVGHRRAVAPVVRIAPGHDLGASEPRQGQTRSVGAKRAIRSPPGPWGLRSDKWKSVCLSKLGHRSMHLAGAQ